MHPFLGGFVERRDRTPVGQSLELPVVRPLLHVTLGADYSFARDGRFEAMPPLSLWGFNSRTRVTRPAGRIHAFVAVLTYRGAELLAPEAPLSANGHWVDLIDRLGDEGSRLLHSLRTARGFAERRAILQAFFAERARSPLAIPTSRAHQVADRIAASEVKGPVAAVAQRAGMSERGLRAQFRARLGVSPKRMLRIARLNRAMRALNPHGWGDGEPGDVRLEFFDDAHFHNEFRQLTGLTPRAFHRHKRERGDTLVYSLPGASTVRSTGANNMPNGGA